MTFQHFIKSNFIKNILKLSVGSLIASIITFLSLPALTRLYNTSDFGNFQIFISIVFLISVISSLKYEMAIVIPKDREDSDGLVYASLICLMITTSIFSGILFLAGKNIMSLLKASSLEPYLFLLAVSIFAAGLLNIFRYILIRNKNFTQLSTNKVVESSVNNSLAIATGIFHPSFIGLVISSVTGCLISSLIIIKKYNFSLQTIKHIKKMMLKYKKFPIINTPSVFINTLSIELPVFMIATYYGVEFVGFFMLARRIFQLHERLIGRSYSQVFMRQAAEAFHEGKDKLLSIYKMCVKQMSLICLIYVVFIFSAPFIVKVLFGENWILSGVFMQIMMFGKFFEFINVPISTTFEIINKQEIPFFLRIASLCVRFLSMYIFRYNIFHMLWALSITTGLYYFTYNYLTFKYIKRI